jgi:hypothetical protein
MSESEADGTTHRYIIHMNFPWQQYAITREMLGRKGRLAEFHQIRHIAHLSDARLILSQGVIRNQLVYDESLLQQYRLPVVWLSPNRWSVGSLYGTIAFEFNFQEIVDLAPRIFWVEGMSYRPETIRLILSASDLAAAVPDLVEFEYSQIGNPLYLQDSVWRRRDEYQYEIMLDTQLPMGICKSISFEDHHKTYCGKSENEKRATNCSETNKIDTIRQLACYALSCDPSADINRLLRDAGNHNVYTIVYEMARDHFFDGSRTAAVNQTDTHLIQLALIACANGYTASAQAAIDQLNTVVVKEFLNSRINERFGYEHHFLDYCKMWDTF